MLKCLVTAALLVSLSLASGEAQGMTARWGKIGPFAVGMLKQAVVYRYGTGRPDQVGGTLYAVDGATIDVSFAKGRITSVGCAHNRCPLGFSLPDGTKLGMGIPYGKTWHGYALCPSSYLGYSRWVKYVHDLAGRSLMVTVEVYHAKVTALLEWQHVGCGA